MSCMSVVVQIVLKVLKKMTKVLLLVAREAFKEKIALMNLWTYSYFYYSTVARVK